MLPAGKGQETLLPFPSPSQVRRAAWGKGRGGKSLLSLELSKSHLPSGILRGNRTDNKGSTTLAHEGGRGQSLLLTLPQRT